MQLDLFTPSGKMSPEFFPTKPMDSVVSWAELSVRIPHSFQVNCSAGPVRVWLMDPSDPPLGVSSMPNISEWPNDANVCSLWAVLEKGAIPSRYYLTSLACKGILRRAVNRGKELPALLARALRAVADSARTSILGGGLVVDKEKVHNAGLRRNETQQGGKGDGREEIWKPMSQVPQAVTRDQKREHTQRPLRDLRVGQSTVRPSQDRSDEGIQEMEHTHPVSKLSSLGQFGNTEYSSKDNRFIPVELSNGDISHCLNAGGMGRIDYETETLVTHALRAEGFDASEDGTGRGVPLVPVAYRTSPNCGAWETGDRIDALTTGTDATSHVLAFSCKDSGADASSVSPTLRAMEFDESHANGGGQVAIAFETRIARNGRGSLEDVVPPLKAESGQTGIGDSAPCVLTRSDNESWAVRRLTPIETSRLQGFPDTYCHIPRRPRKIEPDEAAHYLSHGLDCWKTVNQWFTKCAADGSIYRAHGNSMAVPCMKHIGENIQMVDDLIRK